jgi:hypothetical protein
MHSTYTAFKQGVQLRIRKGNVASPKNTRTGLGGVLLGKLFNIGGTGLIILMALDSVTNFKILC